MMLSLFHRGRFHKLSSARIKVINQNTWSATIPLAELSKVVWDPIQLDTLDGQVFVIDEVEADNAIGHKLDAHALYVTIWAL